MIQVETNVLIRRPLEAVRAYVSDPRNSPAWQLELAEVTKLAVCEAAYDRDCADGRTCVTWAGRVSARGRYRAVEVLIGQITVLQAEVSLALLKKLLETPAPLKQLRLSREWTNQADLQVDKGHNPDLRIRVMSQLGVSRRKNMVAVQQRGRATPLLPPSSRTNEGMFTAPSSWCKRAMVFQARPANPGVAGTSDNSGNLLVPLWYSADNAQNEGR